MDLESNRQSKKYTQAVLDLANEKGIDKPFNEDMLKLQATYSEIFKNEKTATEYRKFARKFEASNKRNQINVIKNIIEGLGLSKFAENFALLLVLSNKGHLLAHIAITWTDIYNNYHGFHKVEVISAVALSTKQQEKINSLIKNKFGNKTYNIFSIDKDILGGLIIQTHDTVYDDSLQTKLQKIKINIIGN